MYALFCDCSLVGFEEGLPIADFSHEELSSCLLG